MRTVLKIPSTESGRAFLRQLREYATPGTRIRARGRGPRAKQAKACGRWARSFDQSIPHKYAAWFGVYIDQTDFESVTKKNIEELRTAFYAQYKLSPQETPLRIDEMVSLAKRRRITFDE